MKHEPADKFQLVTDKIIALLSAGVKPWVRPWHSASGASIYRNLASGNAYSGLNPLLCSIDCATLGDFRPFFLTYMQGQALGWQLQKGSRSTWLRWGGTVKKEKVNDAGETEIAYLGMSKWLGVFHISLFTDTGAQVSIEELSAKYPSSVAPLNDNARDAAVDEYVTRTGAAISHGGDRAFYRPVSDSVHMPALETFENSAEYYATLMHELTHWTGHESRLARDQSGGFGSAAYAYEELVAELGAAFSCNELGINSELPNHASYIDSWLAKLKHDNKFFFRAAGAARSAYTFLHPAA